MYCRNCGYEVESINEPCKKCGFLPLNGHNYCQECGIPTKEGQLICTSCQQKLKFAPSPGSQTFTQQPFKTSNHVVDEPNMGANLAACCSIPFTGLPIVGFILYLVWKDEKPNAANSVCMWSIIPFIFVFIMYMLGFFFGIFGRLLNF